MKRKTIITSIFFIITALCLLVGVGCKKETQPENPDDNPKDDILIRYELNEQNDTYQLKKAITIPDLFEIPETYNNKPVTVIGEFAFSSISNLKEIKLPTSIISIENGAFMNCTNLEKINIPDSVEKIETDAFYLCDKLQYTVINDIKYLDDWLVSPVDTSKTEYNLKESTRGILAEAFKNCEVMNKISIPESVKYIGDFAFETTALKSLTLNDGLKFMGSNIVYGCTALDEINISENNQYFKIIDDVVYSKDQTQLYIYPHYNNSYICQVVDGAEVIMPYAFETTLVETVNLPTTLKKISEGAFFRANHLITMSINSVIEEVGVRAFYGCNDLSSVVFPEGLTSIGDEAFYECTNLMNVSLPASLENIGQNILKRCVKIRDLGIPYLLDSEGISIVSILFENALGVPDTIRKLDVFGGTKIDKLSIGVFQNLTNVSLPQTFSEMEEGVFNNFKELAAVRIDINNPVYKSDNGVLYNKAGTELIYYPVAKQDVAYSILNTTKVIKSGAFNGIKGTIRLIIPDSVTTIQTNAFTDSEALKTINIPNSVINISQNAFNKLPNVVIDVDFDTAPITWSTKWYGDLKNKAVDLSISDRDNQIIWK